MFVLIAGGGVFQRTSTSITHSRVADITTNDNTSAEFTGMFLETVSLVSWQGVMFVVYSDHELTISRKK